MRMVQETNQLNLNPSPLPEDFYPVEGWCKSLVSHYSKANFLLPAHILQEPMDSLTIAIGNVIDIYGNFPESVYKLFVQTIDPLYEPDEYRNSIYTDLVTGAKEENNPSVRIIAECLYHIRRLFEKDQAYLHLNFPEEIAHTPGDTEEEKMEHFAKIISKITRVHINQINKMIMNR